MRARAATPPLPGRRSVVLATLALAAGCGSIGPGRLDRDQLDYARTLSEAGKRQTLLNLVRMRYGDSPSFIAVSQVVSGYTLQSTASAGLNTYPSAAASSFAAFLGAAQYTDRPTFTLSPVTGEQFVQAYLRPFSPADVMPLIQGGIPVDVLLRLVAQTVGPLRNTHPLGGPSRSGSPGFPALLADLRALQQAGALHIRLRREREGARLFISFGTRRVPGARDLAERVLRQLGTDARAEELEVVYGPHLDPPRPGEIPVLTRSLLTVLYAVAAEIEVPEADVRSGRTTTTLREPEDPRPSIVVQTGGAPPAASYVSVEVSGRWFWVDGLDYPSKLAFTILEILKSVAEGARGTALPVLSIPAG